jgi:hypothetical protein
VAATGTAPPSPSQTSSFFFCTRFFSCSFKNMKKWRAPTAKPTSTASLKIDFMVPAGTQVACRSYIPSL